MDSKLKYLTSEDYNVLLEKATVSIYQTNEVILQEGRLSEEIYLVPNDTTGFVLFSKLFTSKAIRIGTTSAKAMDLFIKSQNNDNVFRVTNRIVGINILPSGLGTNSIGINGTIRAQNYFVFNVPQNSGDFQSTDSDTIFGNGGTTQVVYIP